MKKRLFTIIMAATLVLSNFATTLQTKAADKASEETVVNSLIVGDTFEVDNVKYKITSDTAPLMAEPYNASLSVEELYIPSSITYNGTTYQITNIPSGAFYKLGLFTKKIIIEEGIKTIGEMAFQFNNVVTEISLPSTLETFTSVGFESLETIILANGNEHFTLVDGVLFTMDKTKLWLYPSGDERISYSIPEGTTAIGDGSFFRNQHLQSIQVAESVTTVEEYAFCELQCLKTIAFGNNITYFGGYNFYNMPALETMTLKNTGAIGNYCVYNCPSLKSITLGGGFDGFGSYSLYELPSLEQYVVEDVNYIEAIDGVLYNGTKLLRYPSAKEGDLYVVPEGTSEIKGCAFYDTRFLTTIYVPADVKLNYLSFWYPNVNSPVDIYFSETDGIEFGSNKNVFTGLNDGSNLYFANSKVLDQINSMDSVVLSEEGATVNKSVKVIPLEKVSFKESEVYMKINDTFTTTPKFVPFYYSEEVTYTYKTSDPEIVTVSSDGKITAIDTGYCEITLQTSTGLSAKCGVCVSEPKDIIQCSLKEVETLVYTGSECKPEITIYDGNYVLERNRDYTVEYHDNINCGVGQVIINGIGAYTGTKTIDFNIINKSIEELESDDVGAIVYSGKNITPEIVIKHEGYILEKNKDFSVEYKNNIEPGTATAIIIGLGNYKGTKVIKFDISCANMAVIKSEQVSSCSYTGNSIIPVIVLKHGDYILKENVDYTVQYENNKEVGEATAIVKGEGNFVGTKEISFLIVPSKTTIKESKVDLFSHGCDINISWEHSQGATQYLVYYKRTHDSDWKCNTIFDKSEFKCFFGECGEVFLFKVIPAIRIKAKIYYGEESDIHKIIVPSPKPDLVRAQLCKSDVVKVSWEESSGADGYYVYYKKVSDPSYSYLTMVKKKSVKVEDLIPGQYYKFKVVPYNLVDGELYMSEATYSKKVTTLETCRKPKFKRISSQRIKIKWNNIEGESGYQISMSSSKKKIKVVKTITTTTKKSTQIKCKKNKVMFVRVRAYKMVNGKKVCSAWSKPLKIRVKKR